MSWSLAEFVSFAMDAEDYENLLSQPFIPRYRSRIQKTDSLLKKLLNNLFDLSFDLRGNPVSSLYQKYFTSFLLYVNSQIPNFWSLLDLNVTRMAGKSHEDEWASALRAQNGSQLDDVDDNILQYHSRKQEEISDSVLRLTRTLKAQSLVASTIIKRDVRKLDKIKISADANAENLKMTSTKLDESLRNGWSCSFVIMILVIFMVFVGMAIVIRYVKKS